MKETEKRKTIFHFDRIVALASIPIALFLIYNEYNTPNPSIQQTLGPSFMPIAIMIALILSAPLLFFSSLRTERKSGDAVPLPAEPPSKTSAEQYKVMGMVVLGLVVYAVILTPAGFIISTTLLIAWQTQLFEKGKWVRNLVVSVLFSVGVYYLFVHVLKVMLPAGILAL
jgi:putative tricarboxylic transport membrane protein